MEICDLKPKYFAFTGQLRKPLVHYNTNHTYIHLGIYKDYKPSYIHLHQGELIATGSSKQ